MSTAAVAGASTPEGGSGGRLRIGVRKLSDLEPAPYNPRSIDDAALSGLSASVKRFGLVQPIIQNERTGRVVGGHQRLKVLLAEGVTETDVVLVDLDEDEEKALNLALNSHAISGEFTVDAEGLLKELAISLPDLSEALRFDDLAAHLADLFPPPLPEVLQDEVPDPPEDPTTKPGDLWLLGRHRLVCGDATAAPDVELAMGDLKPFIMVTDPPYGVEYDPAWRAEAGLNQNEGRMGAVQNDDRADWQMAYAFFEGDVAYVWHAGVHAGKVLDNLAAEWFEVRAQIIWRKSRFALSRGAYHWGHEPCWYAVRKGKTARWCGDRKQSTVWDIALAGGDADDAGGLGHSTQKPVECMARPIRHHGEAGDVVYDPFLGSGTTLIAAEQLDRTCVGLELSPAYCDVIVARWEALTGRKAERVAAHADA